MCFCKQNVNLFEQPCQHTFIIISDYSWLCLRDNVLFMFNHKWLWLGLKNNGNIVFLIIYDYGVIICDWGYDKIIHDYIM